MIVQVREVHTLYALPICPLPNPFLLVIDLRLNSYGSKQFSAEHSFGKKVLIVIWHISLGKQAAAPF